MNFAEGDALASHVSEGTRRTRTSLLPTPNHMCIGSHLSVHLIHKNKKLTIQELCRMVRWAYSSKKILNGWACAMTLAKFTQKLKYKIYDLRAKKHETDCWNGFISLTCIFFMYNLFCFKPWLCWAVGKTLTNKLHYTQLNWWYTYTSFIILASCLSICLCSLKQKNLQHESCVEWLGEPTPQIKFQTVQGVRFGEILSKGKTWNLWFTAAETWNRLLEWIHIMDTHLFDVQIIVVRIMVLLIARGLDEGV
jgi:hypothetical protein